MLSEERKKELDIFMERASCAGDDYYLDMEQDESWNKMSLTMKWKAVRKKNFTKDSAVKEK